MLSRSSPSIPEMKNAWRERSLPSDQLKELESIYSHDLVVCFFDMLFSRADRSPAGNRCIDSPCPVKEGRVTKSAVLRSLSDQTRLCKECKSEIPTPRVFPSAWAAFPEVGVLKDERAMEDRPIPGSRPKTPSGSKSLKGIKVYSPQFPSPQPSLTLLNSYCLSTSAQDACLLLFPPPIQIQGPGPGPIRKILPTALHATRLVTSLGPFNKGDLICLP